MHPNEKWWLRCNAVLRFMPGEDGTRMADIAAQLPALAQAGFQAIHITAPYASAGFEPWWGLRPLDYFQPNQALHGSMADFAALVNTAHGCGLRVIVFLNLGYADAASPVWQQACQDIRTGTDSPAVRLFRWSNRPDMPLQQTPGEHFLQDGRLHPCPDGTHWYHCVWQAGEIAEPQYDYASPAVQQLACDVLRHWLDTGIDGVIIDAVNHYLNCTWPILRRCITDEIHLRPNVMCIPEGGTGFGDSAAAWIRNGHFDVIEDQTFHSDIHWNGSAIAEAAAARDPDLLHHRLRICRQMRAAGHICWSYPSWGDVWNGPMRLLETAILLGTGHMTEIIPSYLRNLSPSEHAALRRLLQLTHIPALAPIEPRRRLPLSEPGPGYACLCGADERTLALFHLADTSGRIALDSRYCWTDCLSGETFQPGCAIPMGALGWRFLQRQDHR